jgi:Gamma tubulin complex component C-terminal
LPAEYSAIDLSPAPLLSRIYDHLSVHIERRSPRAVTASFAYIFTETSHDYIRHVCHSVGFGSNNLLEQAVREVGKRRPPPGSIRDEDERPDIQDMFDTSNETDNVYPTFFPPELANALPTAKKSLVLLQVAQPDHPLVKGSVSAAGIKWLWTENQISFTEKSVELQGSTLFGNVIPAPNTRMYKNDIAVFHTFDLEPGTHLQESQSSSALLFLRKFLATFPEDLPSMTPTLSLLTSHTFTPLVKHAASLSGGLLSLILSPSSHLNVCEHLALLRSFLLLTSHSFKSRLTSALFSDAVDVDSRDEGTTSMRDFIKTTRRQITVLSNKEDHDKSWAIGLASSLTARETWPPGGADLSFHLRTVIVDSVELGFEEAGDIQTLGKNHVLEEAEFRLGFAIREIPVGNGRDKWLDPLSMYVSNVLQLDY